MSEEPEFTHWKDAWEWHAEQAAAGFRALSEDELIARLQAGEADAYYALWGAFRANGTLAKSGPAFVDFLRRAAGERLAVHRYHASAALFHLLGEPDDPLGDLRRRVQWAHHGEAARQEAVDELEALVRARIAAETG